MVLERIPELLIKGHVVTADRVAKMQERAEFSDYVIQPPARGLLLSLDKCKILFFNFKTRFF